MEQQRRISTPAPAPASHPSANLNAQAGGFILAANIYTDTSLFPPSHQFISCRCVKDRGLGEGNVVLPSNSLQKVTFRAFPSYPTKTMRLNYHIIFQHLNLLSPRLRQFHRRKMPSSLDSPVPLQLHLKALLEDLGPRAVVIEMIATLFVDTVMGQKRQRLIFKSRQGSAIFFLRAIMKRMGRQLKCVQ